MLRNRFHEDIDIFLKNIEGNILQTDNRFESLKDSIYNIEVIKLPYQEIKTDIIEFQDNDINTLK